MTLRAMLRRLPKTVAALDAAIAAMSGLLLPGRLIPDNVDVIGPVVSLLVVVAFLMSVAFSESLRRQLKTVALGTLLALLLLLAIQLTTVCTVGNYGPKGDKHRLLTGFTLTNVGRAYVERLGTSSCAELIQGAGADRVSVMWGRSHVVAAFLYALSYSGFVLGVVLGLGGSELAKRPPAVVATPPAPGRSSG